VTNLHTWNEAVTFEVEPGRVRSAESVEDALAELVGWREISSYRVRTAVTCCLDAIAGECSDEEARRAFIAACRELETKSAEDEEGEDAFAPRKRRSKPTPGRRRPLPWRMPRA
jgi:hypothetical protein